MDMPPPSVPFGYTPGWAKKDKYQVKVQPAEGHKLVGLALIGLGGVALGKHLPAIRRLRETGEAIEFDSGAIGAFYFNSSAPSLKPWERIEVFGERKWLAVEDGMSVQLHDSEEGPSKVWAPVMPHTLFFDEEFGGFMGLIENFLQVIRGAEQPVVSGWDGYHAYELDVATLLACKRNAPVALPLDPATADAERHDIVDYNAQKHA